MADNDDLKRQFRRERQDAESDERSRDLVYERSLRPDEADFTAGNGTFGRGLFTFGIISFFLAVLIILLLVFFIAPRAPEKAGYFAIGSNCSVVTCPAGPIGLQGIIFFFKISLFSFFLFTIYYRRAWAQWPSGWVF